jgi:hypothetical protein
MSDTWPLRDPPPPAPGSTAAKWDARQAELRRARETAVAQWEAEVAQIEADARRERERLWDDNAPARTRALAHIEADEGKLAELNRQRGEVQARLETNREIATRFSEERMPIPETPPKPGSDVHAQGAAHGGYLSWRPTPSEPPTRGASPSLRRS